MGKPFTAATIEGLILKIRIIILKLTKLKKDLIAVFLHMDRLGLGKLIQCKEIMSMKLKGIIEAIYIFFIYKTKFLC